MSSKLGIVAGGGELPAQIISACRESGRDVFVLALKDHALPDEFSNVPHQWIRLGEAGTGIKILHQQGVGEIVLAGRVRRPSVSEIRPDAWTAKLLAKIGLSLVGDDGVLKTLVREIEREGFSVVAPDSLLGGLLAPEGVYGSVEPDQTARDDIARGLDVVHALGAADVGQAAVVQQGHVLGVEAAEGTDALIVRCAGLHRDGPGGVLVKASKTGQERRVDLPTIGARTVELAARSGLRGIAVEAGGALVVGQEAVAKAADGVGIFVVGVRIAA